MKKKRKDKEVLRTKEADLQDPVFLQAEEASEGRGNVAGNDRKVGVEIQSCGAWCFVLGAGLGAFCSLDKGHEGEHVTIIQVFVEPMSKFTISWKLISKSTDQEGDTE